MCMKSANHVGQYIGPGCQIDPRDQSLIKLIKLQDTYPIENQFVS